MSRILELNKHRVLLIQIMFFLCFAVLGIRSALLHMRPSAEKSLAKMAKNQYFDNEKLSTYRGAILDRQGETLALNISKSTIFVNPKLFQPTKAQINKISKVLGLTQQSIQNAAKKKGYFAYLMRRAPEEIGEQVTALDIKGLYAIKEPSRSYPGGTLAAPLLGFVGIDNQGLSGIEEIFDADLQGDPITITPSKDARGRPLYLSSSDVHPDKSGNQIYLTIDRAIQKITENALKEGVISAGAKKGFAIVSDPHTGRLLAVANYPSFDPNLGKPKELHLARNSAFLDVFEPGSVVKPFVVAHALEQKKTTLQSLHNCEGGKLKIGKHTIHDFKPNHTLTTTDVLVNSSNVCIYKIAQKLGPEGLYNALRMMGLGYGRPLTSFDRTQFGRLSPWQSWKTIRFANIAFGQGFVTTALELVTAYSAIANGGRFVTPHLIDRITNSDGVLLKNFQTPSTSNILDPAVASDLRLALQQVVEHPSLFRAQLQDYTAAGKTGTTQKADAITKRYSLNKRIASFAGFAPVNDPYIVVYVNIDEPKGPPYFGSVWAAPVFNNIATETLKYLNATPDKLKSDPNKVAHQKLETSEKNKNTKKF